MLHYYDEEGNLTSATDAEGNETFFSYDIGGNALSMIDANRNTSVCTYDISTIMTPWGV